MVCTWATPMWCLLSTPWAYLYRPLLQLKSYVGVLLQLQVHAGRHMAGALLGGEHAERVCNAESACVPQPARCFAQLQARRLNHGPIEAFFTLAE
jgi:hypothetical protein